MQRLVGFAAALLLAGSGALAQAPSSGAPAAQGSGLQSERADDACFAPQSGLIARTDLPALLAAHPRGGDALVGRFTGLLLRDPANASRLDVAAARANDAQRAALERAYVRAAIREGACREACRTNEAGLIRRTDLKALFARHPDGGPAFVTLLSDLAVRDPSDIGLVERAAAGANAAQRKAVAEALRLSLRQDSGGCCASPEPGLIERTDTGRLLREHPFGGSRLTIAAERLLTRDPQGAGGLTRLARNANRDQKLALAIAFLRAMDALRECPGGGQEAIRNALRTADPSFAAVLAGLSGGSYAGPAGSNFYPGGPGGIASSVATPRLVSPH